MSVPEAKSVLVGIAEGEVGVMEEGGNNRGARVSVYQSATWLKPDPWPWCAAFVCWCIREWLKIPGIAESIGVNSPEKWRPQTAGAFDFVRWAKEKNLRVLPENSEVHAGDLLIYDFSHIGIAAEDSEKGSAYVYAIEGNTNGVGARDSVTGDGVWLKRRARSLVRQIIRLA